jgi:low affinity Fe/Cu permease
MAFRKKLIKIVYDIMVIIALFFVCIGGALLAQGKSDHWQLAIILATVFTKAFIILSAAFAYKYLDFLLEEYL